MNRTFDIPKAQVLRYLGHKNQEINSALSEKIDESIALCKSVINPKIAFREYVLDGFTLKNTNFTLQGADIKRHLKSCTRAVILAATLGQKTDRELLKLMATDKTAALIFDAAGSAAIESFLDAECEQFENATARFSCGYGDFPLSANKDICGLLNAPKILGITVSDNFLLSPKKSVTAVIGIGENRKAAPLCDFNCAACELKKCLYKK